MNYNGKVFKVLSNSSHGEVDTEMRFTYSQNGNILTCSYQSKTILLGHLIGLVDEKGNIDMRYHQVNQKGELKTGTCQSTPELMPNGKLRLHEKWEWTMGDQRSGESTLEEV